jgi:multisubunit Na+/H+ antiporter MnhC subunit
MSDRSRRSPGLGQHRGMEFLGASPEALVRTAVVGSLAYLALVAMLRVSGKRTLSQMAPDEAIRP